MVLVLSLPEFLGQQPEPEPSNAEARALDQLMLELDLTQRRREPSDPVRLRQKRLHDAAGQLITTVLEALDGRRPLRQLLHTRLAEPVHRRLAAQLRRNRPGQTHRLRTVHVCEPAPGVIEASGTIQQGSRVRAVTARLEITEPGWLCTVFAIL
ncbi:Rv3235 family protein [Allokutzneria oryzae]|uniref:Rv3235 family protein n=1 Tax=Allokutzneria oryzae TaxID=1378989 RepID=A0ABV5ZV85_9PSEU